MSTSVDPLVTGIGANGRVRPGARPGREEPLRTPVNSLARSMEVPAAPTVARQAAEMGMACSYVAQATTNDDPRALVRGVSRAFDRLES
jgi:hypothetical protein